MDNPIQPPAVLASHRVEQQTKRRRRKRVAALFKNGDHKMSLMFSVAAPEGLRPDPDESSNPIATLDPSDVVSIDKTLDPWTKVTLTKAGLPLAGWIVSADLIPVQQATVRLFDEPFGNLLQTLTGRIDGL